MIALIHSSYHIEPHSQFWLSVYLTVNTLINIHLCTVLLTIHLCTVLLTIHLCTVDSSNVAMIVLQCLTSTGHRAVADNHDGPPEPCPMHLDS